MSGLLIACVIKYFIKCKNLSLLLFIQDKGEILKGIKRY
jgi:hypothetical protein